ncbi:MAG: sigma 54-interacting transcriptional regulator [Firmicutes bacterium]|nr:sigma 54-interacting transcriptional regulator [Bacillota bacterium]
MKAEDRVFKELFNYTDSILISDVNGKVLYYEDYNDQINLMRYEDAVGRSVFELYPFFKREDFTLFKAIDTKRVIVNELQEFEVKGVSKKALNSAYPLINETGVIGCMVMSVELDNKSGRKKMSSVSAKYNFDDIMTQNIEFKASFSKLRLLSQGDANILIYGETGTGKELIAHTIHANSPRSRKPFIIQNCAAIPGNLIESILFGSSKGSFTGAIDKAGLFEIAKGGTLFLDEANSLSLDLQGKLLRVIENKAVRRIGESFERETDVRIITSTNEPLSKLVERGAFRKDLFYRLNVASFSVPPLRQRKDDIPLLASHYINQYNATLNHSITGIADDVMDFFYSYPWEGNVRELKNVIEYACTIKTSGDIAMCDIPDYMLLNRKDMAGNLSVGFGGRRQEEESKYIRPHTSLADQMGALEKDILKSAFERNRYNITRTADELQISRQTLYNKLNKYGLD